jgi:hypothetical protein
MDMDDSSQTSTSTGGPRARARAGVARVALVLLAGAAFYQGIWAQVAPRSFYDDFPGGLSWVAGDGPYNEHFVRDIGGLADGLGVVALVAAWTLSSPLLVANAAGWLTYAVPHLVFHVVHPLDSGPMQAANVVVLSSQVLLPVVGLLGLSRPHDSRSLSPDRHEHAYTTRAW